MHLYACMSRKNYPAAFKGFSRFSCFQTLSISKASQWWCCWVLMMMERGENIRPNFSFTRRVGSPALQNWHLLAFLTLGDISKHTGEKPRSRELTTFLAFNSSSATTLRRHLKTHSGEKFEDTQCSGEKPCSRKLTTF